MTPYTLVSPSFSGSGTWFLVRHHLKKVIYATVQLYILYPGSLQIALLSLFRAATCEDWTDIMYINMLGCENYGYFDEDGQLSNKYVQPT